MKSNEYVKTTLARLARTAGFDAEAAEMEAGGFAVAPAIIAGIDAATAAPPVARNVRSTIIASLFVPETELDAVMWEGRSPVGVLDPVLFDRERISRARNALAATVSGLDRWAGNFQWPPMDDASALAELYQQYACREWTAVLLLAADRGAVAA